MPKITLPTRFTKQKGTLIDQSFCKYDNPKEFISAGIFVSDLSDHFPHFVSLDILKRSNKKPDFIQLFKHSENSYNAFDMEIESSLSNANISYNALDDPTENYIQIEEVCTTAQDKHLKPTLVRFRKRKHKLCPWMTRGILRSISVRDKLYKNLKCLDPHSDEYKNVEISFKTYRSILQRNIRLAKNFYYIDLFNKTKHDIRKTWASINTVLGKVRNKTTFPEFFNDHGKIIRDPTIITAKFNDFFANIGSTLSKSISYNGRKNVSSYLNQRVLSSFHFSAVDQTQVLKIVNDLAPKTSCGRDNLSTKLLQRIVRIIINPLTVTINQSLNTGIFPDRLKIAKVIPLFKKDDNHEFGNYRPISLLPCISKVLEKVVFIQVYDYFTDNNLWYGSQYGFRKGHSTELASLELVDRVYKTLDDGKIAISVFLDLSKAFDTLDHNILMQKLSFYGINGVALNWFKSYLQNRCQYVVFNDHCSELLPLTTGVPQGSILGPLLFIIYMNDVNFACRNFKPIIYADDTNLFSPICSFDCTINGDKASMSSVINNELALVQEWLNINKLSLNVKKTKYMLFHHKQRKLNNEPINLSINNQPIERVNSFNFLGLTLDENMTWNAHIQCTSNKIARTIGVVNRLKHSLPLEILRYIYNALILPHLQYALLTWGFKNNRLFKLQKRAIRVITRSKYNAHTEPLFRNLNLLKLDDMFKLNMLKTYYKFKNGNLPDYIMSMFSNVDASHGYNTRTQGHLKVQYAKTASCQKCIRFVLPRLINETEDEIISKVSTHSFQGFNKYIKRYMLNNYSITCQLSSCYICNRP